MKSPDIWLHFHSHTYVQTQQHEYVRKHIFFNTFITNDNKGMLIFRGGLFLATHCRLTEFTSNVSIKFDTKKVPTALTRTNVESFNIHKVRIRGHYLKPASMITPSTHFRFIQCQQLTFVNSFRNIHQGTSSNIINTCREITEILTNVSFRSNDKTSSSKRSKRTHYKRVHLCKLTG